MNPANITWIKARTVVNIRAGIIAPALTPSGTAESYVIVGLPELRTYGERLAYKF